ncbi:MAG TPA: YafY family protein [Lapillicoccus sp.]|jgi:predicted DNA-binding transcriptional regulator YafY|uniref:helix-turn-helix transcriptional regulator n=1 Tax=Lapillicoccus sp. TaxID=1909287 RepID=UPI002F91E2B3
MANTSSRTLRLLSLLQTHRFWPGPELADRLEVSERTLRRDIERLRELGYPVDAARGSEGGYQLGAGATMPPLTVDEDEAIAMAVALNGAAQMSSGALSEASVSALSKVVQVLPPRLRRRAEALRAVTVDSPFSSAPPVRADVLATVAQSARDTERLRFTYRAAGGASAGSDLGRHVEPHRLVTVGRRWYLVAYDLDRQDWRSFRLDRLREPVGTRARFRPRSVPGGDAAAFVRDGMSRGEQELHVVALVSARSDVVGRRIGRWGQVSVVSDESCRLEMSARDARWIVFGLAIVDAPFELVEAPEAVRHEMAAWAGRFAAAGRWTSGGGARIPGCC